MDEGMWQDKLEKLMADERLVELCELHRTGDSIFDVVSFMETQHSSIMAWMLDPKEGHGQGDEILRDLLVAASVASHESKALREDSATASFFRTRPPSALRVASFASAFTAKELGVKGGRFDLFVVDPQNRFVLVIENKAGTRHHRTQLDGYEKEMTRLLKRNRHLKDYERAFIALDAYFDPDFAKPRAAADKWVHLGYEWLETTATRAQGHLDRGNASARLVAAYCQAVWEFELPRTRQIERLAAELYRDHPDAVRQLASLNVGRAEMTWLQDTKVDQKLAVFGLQNKSVIRTLHKTNDLASVRLELIRSLATDEDHVETVGRNVHVCPRDAEDFQKDEWWPVLIRIRPTDDGDEERFNVWVIWNGNVAVTRDVADELRAALTSVYGKFSGMPNSMYREVPIKSGLTRPAMKRVVAECEQTIRSTFRKMGVGAG